MGSEGGTTRGRRRVLRSAGIAATIAGFAGCLRLSGNSNSSGESGAADVEILSVKTPDEELSPGDEVEFRVAIRNLADEPEQVTVIVEDSDGEIQRAQTEVEANENEDVRFQHTFSTEGRYHLEARLLIGGVQIDKNTLGEFTVKSRWPITLEWGDLYTPAERKSDSTDTRKLAFFCSEIRIEDTDGITQVVYNIGGPSEPEFVEGAYNVERHDEFKRWFGTPNAETTFLVEELDPSTAGHLVLVGSIPPFEGDVEVTVYKDGAQTDSRVLEASDQDRYEFSLDA